MNRTRRALLRSAPAVLALAAPTIAAPATARAAHDPGPSDAIVRYRAVMARMDAVNAGSDWDAVERFCKDDEAAVQAVADAPHGGIADLLRKVVIVAERNKLTGFHAMDCEADLIESVAEHARALLAGGVA